MADIHGSWSNVSWWQFLSEVLIITLSIFFGKDLHAQATSTFCVRQFVLYLSPHLWNFGQHFSSFKNCTKEVPWNIRDFVIAFIRHILSWSLIFLEMVWCNYLISVCFLWFEFLLSPLLKSKYSWPIICCFNCTA